MSFILSFKYFHKSFALTIVTMMKQQIKELMQPELTLSQCVGFSRRVTGDSASALPSEDMLAALQIQASSFRVLIWQPLLAFLFVKDAFFLAY